MTLHPAASIANRLAATLCVSLAAGVMSYAQDTAKAPLAIDSARVSIAGASNIHTYSATTDAVRVTNVKLGAAVAGASAWDAVVQPGGVEAFDVAIAAATLSSPKEGLDKNMHKALKVQEHPDIVFRLTRLAPGIGGAIRATGTLRIAGVEREVAFDLKTERRGNTLAVKGELPLLMTDYGIKPPTAMLGMLKTDPKVTVTIEAAIAIPLT